jgi:hypothetical protein
MKEVLPRLSLAGNLEKPLMSLYGTEWRGVAMGLSKKSAKSKNRVYLYSVGGGSTTQYILIMD